MECKQLSRAARPASLWHGWFCRECRAARAADRTIALGLACIRAQPAPVDGLSGALRAVGLNPESTANARLRARRIGRHVTTLLVLVFGSLVTFSGGWLYWIDRDPGLVVPSPTMPANNAFSTMVAAANMVKDDGKVGYALSNKPPDPTAPQSATPQSPAMGAPSMATPGPLIAAPPPDAANVEMRAQAAASLSLGDAIVKMHTQAPASPMAAARLVVDDSPEHHVYTHAEKIALVAENEHALARMHEGLAPAYLQPPARSFSTAFPYYNGYRKLARVLALDAQVKIECGDWMGAMGSCLDAIQMGRHIQHGASLIGKLVGIACEAIGRSAAWDIADHLSGPEAREAARRLESVRAEHVTTVEALTEEKWGTLAGLEEVLRSPRWRWGGVFGEVTADNPRGDIRAYLMLLRYSKSEILNDYSNAMDGNIEAAGRPYASSKRAHQPEYSDPILNVLYPVFDGVLLKDTENETQNALLEISLALRAYRVEHAAYPMALDGLAPEYVRAVPTDLFAVSPTQLRYAPKGAGYLLYSVGPDTNDDGGVAIRNPYVSNGSKRVNVTAESRGDVVAGIVRN